MGGLFSSSSIASPTAMNDIDLSVLPRTFITSDTPGRAWLCVTGTEKEAASGGGHWSLLFDFGLWNKVGERNSLPGESSVGLEVHLG
jgi:hypothetical protein